MKLRNLLGTLSALTGLGCLALAARLIEQPPQPGDTVEAVDMDLRGEVFSVDVPRLTGNGEYYVISRLRSGAFWRAYWPSECKIVERA